MKALHISDWHGEFIFPDAEYDIVISSGDMTPNFTTNMEQEKKLQKKWVCKNVDKFFRVVGNKPFLSVSGNHDFINLARVLRENGFESFNLNDKELIFNGIKFYGLPWIPHIKGRWNYEASTYTMSHKVRPIPEDTNVLITHCPPYGYLDMGITERFGNTVLSNHYHYSTEKSPRLILCGHIHECGGYTRSFVKNSIVINSALTYRIVDI